MSQIIRDVFDNPGQVESVIQKVIDFKHKDSEALKREVQEYVVTNHIRENMEKMLEWIELSMSGSVSEVGAWVSGFYGSGKSSFTKYLGFAFDKATLVDGKPFVDLLSPRIDSTVVSQRLKTLARNADAAVLMLDLSTENMVDKPVSEVLLLHVMRWAGFSKHGSIAEFEQLVRADGRWKEMLDLCQIEEKRDWMESHDKLIIAKGLAKKLAQRMYPGTEFAFDSRDGANDTAEDKARKIIQIIQNKTGRQNILIIIDEVGQYIGSNERLILDMQGLVQSMRTIGKGHVLVVATAQQTLLDTNEKTALNGPYLVKLKDRFPMQVMMESSDIAEICYRRLLKKSPAGEKALRDLFAQNGQRFAARAKLTNSKAYESGVDEKRFIDLYPFLPSHFNILLSLLAELSKGRGGLGLRSAIKVVQDVLTGGHVGGFSKDGLIARPLGTMVTGAWLYDVLREDIESWNRPFAQTVEKTLKAYDSDNQPYTNVAKTLAIAMLLPDFETSPRNIAALLQDTIEANVTEEEVERILQSMATEKTVPVSDHSDGTYYYLNEVQERLDLERASLSLQNSDFVTLKNQIFGEVFKDHLSAQPYKGLSVNVALFELDQLEAVKARGGEALRMTLALYSQDKRREDVLASCRDQSIANPAVLYLVAELPESFDFAMSEILRSTRMAERYQDDPQAKSYAKDQREKAEGGKRALAELLKQKLSEGVVAYRGSDRALEPGNSKFDAQIDKHLCDLGKMVFDKYPQAAVVMKTNGAMGVLHARAGKPLEKRDDPLELLETQKQRLEIKPRPAVESVNELFAKQDGLRGSELLEFFTRAPYGWSKEVTQYVLAALFVAGKLELNISGRPYITLEPAVEDVFASPKNLRPVGIRLRQDGFSEDELFECNAFLTDHGVSSVRLEEADLWNESVKFMAQNAAKAESLLGQVTRLNLYGKQLLMQLKEQLERLENGNLREFLKAIQNPQKTLDTAVRSLERLQKAQRSGLFETIGQLQSQAQELAAYRLKKGVEALLQKYQRLQEGFALPSFMDKGADYRQLVGEMQSAREQVIQQLREDCLQEQALTQQKIQELASSYALTEQETAELQATVSGHVPVGSGDCSELNAFLASILQAKGQLESNAAQIRARRPKPVTKRPQKIRVPLVIKDETELQKVIDDLQRLKAQMAEISEIEVQLGN